MRYSSTKPWCQFKSLVKQISDSCWSAHFLHLPVGAVRGLQVFCRDNIQRQNGIHSSFIYLCFISYTPWKGEEEESINIQTAIQKEFVFPNIISDNVINKQL